MPVLSRCLAVLSLLACGEAALAFDPGQRLAFVTSVQGTANLQSWVDSGGHTGLAAADAICVARATAAGLPAPDQFVAWLSDSSDDAYCRLHGLHGQRAGNCGQASLPKSGGPWFRVDGAAFADDVVDLTDNGQVFRTLDIDEYGQPSPATLAWSQTFGNGAKVSFYTTCSDWSSAAAASSSLAGSLAATTEAWSGAQGLNCSNPAPLYCLQKGTGGAVPLTGHRGRPAFLSGNGYKGNFGAYAAAGGQTGLAAADALCRAEAASLGLPRPATFRAWLSDGVVSPASRFANDGPWYRADGVRVADGLSQLASATPFQPLNLTPGNNIGYFATSIGVWTGLNADGSPAAETCAGWTLDDAGSSGADGLPNRRNPDWRGIGPTACSGTWRLYCLADNDTLYAAGFQ